MSALGVTWLGCAGLVGFLSLEALLCCSDAGLSWPSRRLLLGGRDGQLQASVQE